MLEINLKQLEAFVATAEYCSFTRAAEALYLTQSTVSTHVASLERSLSCRLIQRGARQRVLLTDEGKRVYKEAKEILDRCWALQEQRSQPHDSQLDLGASTVPGQYLLPELMAGFRNQYPESSYLVLRGDSMQVHRMMDEGKVRLGFVGAAEDRKRYCYHAVAEDRLVLITANQEPYQTLHENNTPGWALLDRPMLLREESSGTRKALEAYLKHRQIPLETLHPVAQIDNPEAIKSSVSRDMGVAVLSKLTVQEEVREGKLLCFDLDADGAFRKIYLTWRRDMALSPLEDKFVRYVKKRLSEVDSLL